MITLTTVGYPLGVFWLLYSFAFMANFVILTFECRKLSQNMILLCQNGYKEMSV